MILSKSYERSARTPFTSIARKAAAEARKQKEIAIEAMAVAQQQRKEAEKQAE
jgi:hypothetical protein